MPQKFSIFKPPLSKVLVASLLSVDFFACHLYHTEPQGYVRKSAYVSCLCGQRYESHLQLYLLTYPEVNLVYDVRSSIWNSANMIKEKQNNNNSLNDFSFRRRN